MQEPTLIIMAAGMASRFGSLKQVEPITNNGEFIIDFSIYDAIKAGFKKVAFIIKREDEEIFRNQVGMRIKKHVEVSYIFQDITDLPMGFSLPKGRVKPWGTAHAILCCKNIITTPFAVINADDFYGRDAFINIYNFLKQVSEGEHYAMIGYVLENTLSSNGTVTRGVCEVKDGFLVGIDEKTQIKEIDNTIICKGDRRYIRLKKNATVSMNVWGFTPSIFSLIETGFMEFLELNLDENPLNCEFILTFVVGHVIRNNKNAVKVIKSKDKWFGMTYKEDKPELVEAIKILQQQGVYPVNLWS
ncbi:nucleotidyltransferase [Candidatus Epulonipiscioides gigas]|nr:nucleotidyltransferase [Epulopiscium sp. SCG-C07WGA-EpuloA2]